MSNNTQPLPMVLSSETPERTSQAISLALAVVDKLAETLLSTAAKDDIDAERLPEEFVARTQQSYELALWRLDSLLDNEDLWAQFRQSPEVRDAVKNTLRDSAEQRCPNFAQLRPQLVAEQGGVAFVYVGANMTVIGRGNTVEQARKDFENACTQQLQLRPVEFTPAEQPQPESAAPSKPEKPRRRRRSSGA